MMNETIKNKEKMIEPRDNTSRPLSAPLQLSNLPAEVLTMHIGSYLDNRSKARCSQTSQGFYQWFNGGLKKIAIEKLGTHVLYGEEKETLLMIEHCPARLRARSTATDYSGRIFEGVTLFQMAILSHDVALWKKIEPFFNTLSYGQAEKVRQFREIFPQGLPEQRPYDFSALIHIISNSSDTDLQTLLDNPLDTTTTLGQVINTFRKEFKKLTKEETFYNPEHLVTAFNIYSQQFNSWLAKQHYLFWSQVIGYIQRFLPTCYAQSFCQGLYKIATRKEPLKRSLKITSTSKAYYPIENAAGLGYDFGAYSYNGIRQERRSYDGVLLGRLPLFNKLCRANSSELRKLQRRIQQLEQPSTDCNLQIPTPQCCTIS